MKVAVIEFGNESNSFAAKPCDIKKISIRGWNEPGDIEDYLANRSSKYMNGMVKAAEEEGIECIFLPSLTITAGPAISREAMAEITERMSSSLEKSKDEADGLCFALHGATCSEDDDDIEGFLLEKFRKILGKEKPIMASADLHANVSEKMVENSDGIFGIKEYPHNDRWEAGYTAMKNLALKLKGKRNPQMSLVNLPLIFPVGIGDSYSNPIKEIKDYFEQYRKAHGLIDTTFFHGFPQSDGEYTSVSVIAIADGYKAEEHAKALAQYVWERRNKLLYTPTSADEALEQAKAYSGEGYVVINEPSDNMGSGTPGDGTMLLRALIEHNIPRSIFSYIHDAETVAAAYKAGVGAKIDIKLGAKTDGLHGTAIELSGVEVLAATDSTFRHESPMSKGTVCNNGKIVRLRYKNVEFIVSEIGKQTLDNGQIKITGGNPDDYKIICLKSANHFRSYFASRAAKIITADTQGIGSNDLFTFNYKKLKRPIFPLDKDVIADFN